MYFYIKNKKWGPIFFYMKIFFYFHRFIFKNTSGILKKNIYLLDFFKKNKSLEIKIFLCSRAHDTIQPALVTAGNLYGAGAGAVELSDKTYHHWSHDHPSAIKT